ncbi:MAG: PP2C family protein-serine/threonine phosphatase [Planctomycetota bacterium]
MRNYPEYPRLHVEANNGSNAEPRETCGLAAVCDAFAASTGWTLEYRDQKEEQDPVDWSMVLGDGAQEFGHLLLFSTDSSETTLPLQRVEPLAQAVGHLTNEWLKAQSALWQREAELAAGIPVTLQPADRLRLARQLESVLRGGAEAVDCHAAALYLLDDATSHLKLRAAWKLPKSRFWEEPRPLRGSVADLEALIGQAVALEDTALLPHWKVPENYPAALCVPVSTSSTPLGTLWFFANQTRDFTPEQVHMAEIVSGRLAAELEREVLARDGLRNRDPDINGQTLARWQDEMRPRISPLVDGWQIAADTGRQQDQVSEQFHDWSILPDGRIALAIGHAEGPPCDAVLTCVALQVAFRSHAAHPHEARQMLEHLNESLWTHSTGNRFASLFYAMIDPDSGHIEYSCAGQTHSLLCGAEGIDPLTDDNPQLGLDPDYRYHQVGRTMRSGDSLVAFNRRHLTPLDEELCDPDECRVAEMLQKLANVSANEQAQAVADELGATSLQQKRTVVVARRTV